MRNLIRSIKRNNIFINSTFLASLLLSLIFISYCIIDRLTINSNTIIYIFCTIVATRFLTKWSVKKFKALQFNQIIKEEGPTSHIKKEGTPTMGGIVIVPFSLMIANIININQGINQELIAINILTIGFMAIGVIDDYRSIANKNNTGLKPNAKIFSQLLISIIFLIFCFSNHLISSDINIFNNQSIDLKSLIWPLGIFVILAESNATNLTDGLDGLASGCGAIVLAGLSIELMLRGNHGDIPMASLCIIMSSGWLGFLLINKNPAKIFMGDAGSLAMGALLAGIALLSNTLFGLLIMGFVFLAESLSVIIQVLGYKISKRISGKGYRIFKMAPLHHHFELNGLKEIKIVRNFWMISISFVLMRFLFL